MVKRSYLYFSILAKYGNYCNFGWFTPPDKLQDLLDTLKDHCKTVGRDYESVGKSFFASVLIDETEDGLTELMEKRAALRNITLEEYMKGLPPGVIAGTPEVVEKRLLELIDLGFDYFQVMFPYPDDYQQSNEFARLVLKKM